MNEIKKRDGFIGEEAIVLPQKVIQQTADTPFLNSLFITDIGYYPRAKHHFRERRNGINQHILIFCVDGKGESVVEGKKHILRSTNYLMIPAWMKHVYWSSKDLPWTIFWIHFRGTNAGTISEILYRNMLNGNNSVLMSEQIKILFYQMFSSLQKGYGYNNMLQLTIILHNYLSQFIFPDPQGHQETDNKEDIIDAIVNFLKENVHKPLSLSEIASRANYSPTHFSTKFKKMTGYSPLEYFNHLKLQKACHLLRFTQLRIGEIADAIGIEDPYYFSRLFKNQLGVSPKEFRSSKQLDKPIL